MAILSSKSGPLGEKIKNPLDPAYSDFSNGGSTKVNSTSFDLGLEADVIAQTFIQNKLDFMSAGGGSKLEYPLDVSGNPAYAATVKFQIMEYAMPNEGESQKNHAQTPVDNISKETEKPKTEQQIGMDGPADTAASSARFSAAAYQDDAASANVRNPGFQFVDDAAVTKSFVKTKSEEDADTKNILAGSGSKFKIGFQKKMGSPSIVMYFPASQTFYDNIAYGSADLQVAGAAIEGASEAGSEQVGKQIKAAVGNFATGVIDVLSDISGAISGAAKSEAGRLAASRTLGKIPIVGTAATLLNRMVINPNVRTLFNGVNVREFAFQFKFISTSPQEGEIIQKIIKTFRKEAYPEAFNMQIGDATNVALGYNFPNAFKITFNFKGAQNLNIPKILPCYLRSVSHTINPTGGGFRNDGKPNEIDLTLTFSEFRALTSQDIEKGY